MMQGQGIIAAPPTNPTQQQLQQQQVYAYQQQMGYWYPTGYPAQMAQAAQYMQQGYAGYPFAYASPQQQNAAAAAGYRMIQPTAVPANMAAWGVPPPQAGGAAIQNSISNGSSTNSNGTPQPMLYTMQQFQTQ